jgi:SAM-dependent methyltransferase
MSTLDWGLGEFEGTARQLLPAAEAAIALAGLKSGQHVVDVGGGTGNAALLAAEQPGVRVTGVDPAPRLLDVARAAAAARGLDVEFLPGDAASMPLPDGSADVLLSVFAVIFASDPRAAAAEMSRVASDHGRVVVTAWIPEGPVIQGMKMIADAVGKAGGAPGGPMFGWHEADQVSALFRPHGFQVSGHERSIVFRAPTLEAFWQTSFLDHPLMVATKPMLEEHGLFDEVRTSVKAALASGNESMDAFQVTSRFVVITAER